MKKLWSLLLLPAALAVPRLSAVTVTTLNDNGPGSLRAAIAAGGNIDFGVTGTITLTNGELVINGALVISGPGADHLTVQRNPANATPAFRVLRVDGGAVTISGLTIRNGFATDGDRDGGGILNRGSLTLNDCVVSGNRSDANGRGAGIYNAYAAALTVNRCVFANNVAAEGEGGGIYVFGEATINDSTFRENRGAGTYSRGGGLHVDYFGTGHVVRCTFSGNSVAGVNAQGGGIYNYGALDIVNSTFSGNSSGGSGGGLHVDALSRGTTIRNCTITGNSATEGAGIYNNGFHPYNTGRITISDSIVAGNLSAAEDIDNSGVVNSGGHNLFGVIGGNNIVAGAGDRFGLGADALKLGSLASNGGPTQTRALLAGSPAIDAGNETLFPATDQRGVPRPFGARADIGAFELDQLLPTNQPPTISIISPANGAAFTAPANIFLIASVHDPDGIAVVAMVEFFAGTNKLGNGQPFDPGPPHDAAFLFYWTNVPPGEYDLTAKVTDDHRATTISAPVNIRVNGADNLPVVRITATDANAAEPHESGTFTVSRDGPTNNALNVFYLIRGSASNGLDYVTLSNRVTLPTGVRSSQVNVVPIDDALVEPVETVELRLTLPDGLPTYAIGSPSNAVVTILDNDPLTNIYQPIVTIEATDAHASEASVPGVIDPGVFTVYRAGNTSATLYVRYRIDGTASNGLDYLSISNIVVIPAGAASARIVINPWYDSLPEGTETVVLHLEEPVCIAIFPPPPDCYRVGTPSNATIYIADFALTNHPPTAHIFTPTNGSSFVAPANIFIAAQAQDVDGYLTIQTVEFFEGTHSLGIRTNYPTLDPIGPFKLTWTNVPPGNYVLTARATDNDGAFGISPPVEIRVGGTNQPPTNHPPIVTITAPDAIASEGTNWYGWPGWTNHPPADSYLTNTATFVVRRTGDTNTSLSVLYEIGGTASNGVDYAALPGSVIIPAGHGTAEIKIVPVDDALPERIETVVLALVGRPTVSNTPTPYVVGQPRRAAAIIVDNDQPRPLTGMLPDRNFHIMRPGDSGTRWRIECSTDLVHWSALCTNSVTDGALHFVDPDGDELPQRFYRALPEASPPPSE